MATIARTSGGLFALGLVALGLAAFACWQLSAAATGFRWVEGAERVRRRIGAVAKAIAMSGLAAVVVDYLAGMGTQGATARGVAGDVLALPAGRVLLGLAASAILVIAGAMT